MCLLPCPAIALGLWLLWPGVLSWKLVLAVISCCVARAHKPHFVVGIMLALTASTYTPPEGASSAWCACMGFVAAVCMSVGSTFLMAVVTLKYGELAKGCEPLERVAKALPANSPKQEAINEQKHPWYGRLGVRIITLILSSVIQ